MKFYQPILICIALYAAASAQTSEQLFNPAAKEYIYGNTPAASNLVEQALVKFPEDEKLLKLKKLIEEQKQNQDQQNQNNQNQQDQKNQEQQKQDQQQDQTDPSDQTDQEPQQRQPSAAPQQAGEMSEEEAKQLLDAMKQDEQDQRANLTPYLGAPVQVEKDW
jgi:hypothetical protein